jgi:hypothetical protein
MATTSVNPQIPTTSSNSAPVDHDIVIVLRGNEAIPKDPLLGFDPGETVRYSSPDGKVTIEFKDNGSPFDVDVVEGGQIVKVRDTKGSFRCRCFVTPAGSTERIGWRPGSDLSGADHDVPRTK